IGLNKRMSRLQASTSVVVLAVLTVAAVAVGTLNLREQRRFRLPEDGVVWRDSFGGIVAESLTSEGPAAKAGLQAGDFLVGINGQNVSSAAGVAQELFALGTGAPGSPGAEVRYEVVRGGFPAEFQIVLEPQTRPTVRLYLQIAGVFYLALGLFVLWRRARAPAVLHFYWFCLASFVLFVFSYTGRLDTFDWTVYWASIAALLLQPALFVHFCRAYPHSVPGFSGPPRGSRWALAWIYGPAGLLGAVQAGVALGALRVAAPLSEIRWWLDRVEIAYFAGMFLVGIGLLARAYGRIRSRAGRKQVGWVLGGSALAGVPFTVGYAVPYFLGATPGAWMNFAALSLVFLPITFAYAALRHRLLDVEIVLERGLVYTLATGTLVGAYLGLVALAGDFFQTYFPGAGTVGLVGAVIATGLLFQPLQRAIQARLERYFLRKRYDYRGALMAFGRELSSTTNPDLMIASLLGQLSKHLQVGRAAVFVPTGAATESGPSSFVLRGSVGVDADETFDFGFLGVLRSANPAGRDRLFFQDWDASVERELDATGEAGASFTAWQAAIAGIELHYYFPCRSKNRLIAVLGVGKTTGGEFLSDEDTALLETLAGYLAVAMENATLVESLETKAEQYEKLQQFSENILESINVGLLAVDLEDRIEAVNTPLELMWPLPFRESLGKKLADVLPPDLTAQLERLREDGDIHNIYRYRVPDPAGREGRERAFHIAVAPLLSKTCDAIGRLIIVDDVTDRVVLEAQLAQAEKLSSVGLLAAGVAHEVNTPLTVISTQAQMLAKQLPVGERASKILDKIIGQTFRASEIVNSLLNFSRTQGAAFAPLDLNKTLADTLLLVDHALKTARIEVESLCD
ncbi:MAG: multi-sensor signal transduction histidine kinase, partial [Acidobacteria bacterium]|nr:multi-sensor signal transduction histidine kinase [Acidobacteriota bacterium]